MLLFNAIYIYAQGPSFNSVSFNSGREFANVAGITTEIKDKDRHVYIDKKNRLRCDVKSNKISSALCISCNLDETQDYTIDAMVEQIDANDEKGYGIVFGFKDWDNYSCFLISGNLYYKFYTKYNGVIVEHVKWTYAGYVLFFGDSSNRLQIWKRNNQFLLIANGHLLTSVDAFKLLGNNMGFFVGGKGQFSLDNFYVKEFASTQEDSNTSNKNSNEQSSGTIAENSKSEPQIVGSGTGFVIDRRGYLATNYHVTENAATLYVCLQIDGEWKSYHAKVIKNDPTNDLSIIKIDDDNFFPFNNLPYNMTFDAEDIASEIYTLGYPQVQVMGTDVKYTMGVINAKTGIQGDPTHYQISAHIDHGNSGGPLFNSKGEIIGITDSGLDKAKFGDVNYAIKSMYLKALSDALPVKLQLPSDSSISELSRTEQIKILSKYTALILVAQ